MTNRFPNKMIILSAMIDIINCRLGTRWRMQARDGICQWLSIARILTAVETNGLRGPIIHKRELIYFRGINYVYVPVKLNCSNMLDLASECLILFKIMFEILLLWQCWWGWLQWILQWCCRDLHATGHYYTLILHHQVVWSYHWFWSLDNNTAADTSEIKVI